jgi:hypothetical protein
MGDSCTPSRTTAEAAPASVLRVKTPEATVGVKVNVYCCQGIVLKEVSDHAEFAAKL